MHPALSVIIFSTMSGAGYGLAALLGLGVLPFDLSIMLPGYVLALIMIGGGLLSSTAHLGRPERFWRAFSQWRTSWLSREGVLAIVAFLPIVITAWGAIIVGEAWPLIGVVSAVLCLVTVYATSMIYVSLKTVHQWHTPLTSFAFLVFALAGGLIAASAITALAGLDRRGLYVTTLAVLGLAWAIKSAWWNRANRVPGPSTPESATGLGSLGAVRLLESPHAIDNYLTREMAFRIARKHADKLRLIAITLGAAIPGVLLVIAALTAGSLVAVLAAPLALLAHMAGMLVERWLFFAEARHTVSLYYGASSA